jgi:hypothetical protein
VVDAEHIGHVGRSEVLVDHSGNASADALGPAHHGNAATAACNHDGAAPRQHLDQRDVDELARPRRGNDMARAHLRIALGPDHGRHHMRALVRSSGQRSGQLAGGIGVRTKANHEVDDDDGDAAIGKAQADLVVA